MKRSKKSSISSLKKKAWKVFSLYIRNRDSENGHNFCVCCGAYKPIKEMDAAHFISRRFQNTLFDERNVWPNCQKCNRFLNGNWTAYYLYMKHKFGQEMIDELLTESKKLKKWTIPELQEIIKRYS